MMVEAAFDNVPIVSLVHARHGMSCSFPKGLIGFF